MPEYFIRKSQLAGEIEATPGTAETLAVADVALKPLSDGFTYETNPQRFENLEVADDIGTALDFVTAVPATMNIPVTLKASGVLATAPAIGKYLRACAMKQQQVKSITIGAISGDGFAYGESISTAGKTAICDEAIGVGGGTLRYISLTGGDLADAETITGDSGDNGATSGASTDIGWKYSPTTESQETMTLQRGVSNTDGTAGQDWIQVLRGAMGTFSMEVEALNSARMNFSFQGVEESAGVGDVFASPTFESVAIENIPKFINGTIEVNSVTVRPTSVSLDMGNEIVLEPDPSTNGGTGGYDFARVSSRAPTIRVDPRTINTLDDHNLLSTGSAIPFRLTFGTSPQQIDIITTSAQLRELTLGDRNGFQTSEKTLAITRHATLSDEDFRIYFL